MGIFKWIDYRLPIFSFIADHLKEYPAPKNLNIMYYFGSFAILVLTIQITTGIWMLMYYVPTAEGAFKSVEVIMRDVYYGWLLRYCHTTGASAFFIVLYLHMLRGIMYGSFKDPRQLLWLTGVTLFLLVMAEAYTGYVLPWGQMSYWAAKVIISLFGAIPWVGKSIVIWIQGDYTVSGVTLQRFFAFHVVAFPLILLGMVFIHILALHRFGSNNPDGIEISKHLGPDGKPIDSIPFHPYYTVKDLMGAAFFLFLFMAVVFYKPNFYGLFIEPENYIPANPLVTPPHIKPVWYFSPFYAILRAIPDKALGALAMLLSVLVLFTLPWLDTCRVKSIRYRSWYTRITLILFIVSFVALGYFGTQPVNDVTTWGARIASIMYALFFLLQPILAHVDKDRYVPSRLT